MSYCSASKPLMLRFCPVGSALTVVPLLFNLHSGSRDLLSLVFASGDFRGIGAGQPFSGHSMARLFLSSSVHASFLSRRSMRTVVSPSRKREIAPSPFEVVSLRCMFARV